MSKNFFQLVLDRVVVISLFFLLAGIPLFINPFALDYWYKPKVDSLYSLIIILCSALLVRAACFNRVPRFTGNPLRIPLALFGAAGVLSVIFSIAPEISVWGDSFREEGVFTILSYITLTLVFSCAVETETQIHDLLKGLLISAFAVSSYALAQYAGYNPTEHFIPLMRQVENRPGSTIGNPNFLGKFLVLIIPIFMVFWFRAQNHLEQVFCAVGSLIACAALIVTFTRASWFSCFASMLLLGVLIRKTTKRTIAKKIFFLTGAVLLFVVLVEFQRPLSGPQRNRRESRKVTEKITATFDTQKGGVGGRLYLWEKGILLIKDRPVFGYGLDTHVRVLDKFNLEYARRFNYTGIIDRVHNNYLDLAIAEGLLGLTAYLIIIITFLVWLARTINAEADASRRLLYCGILSAACGYLLNDFFIFSVVSVSPAFWSLMGITISMKRLNGLAPHDKA